MEKYTHISAGLLVAGLLLFGVQASFAFLGGSDTDRYETQLQSHWQSFSAQQAIVDRAKKTQALNKWNIISTLVDLSNSKVSDLQSVDEKDQEAIAKLSQKALCFSRKANGSDPEEWMDKDLEKHIKECTAFITEQARQ